MIGHQVQDTSALARSGAPKPALQKEHNSEAARSDAAHQNAMHSLNEPLLRQYLQGMCDDPRLVKTSGRYVTSMLFLAPTLQPVRQSARYWQLFCTQPEQLFLVSFPPGPPAYHMLVGWGTDFMWGIRSQAASTVCWYQVASGATAGCTTSATLSKWGSISSGVISAG